ncbi:hypothetical protein HGRIS_000997 [Hohenbuehelia grisea]|uniref:Uncharacterized protein n=1 Tax=Hohenbuehelia grisea TaxID=104357 RepID=A0ABR3IQE5_9AGAR
MALPPGQRSDFLFLQNQVARKFDPSIPLMPFRMPKDVQKEPSGMGPPPVPASRKVIAPVLRCPCIPLLAPREYRCVPDMTRELLLGSPHLDDGHLEPYDGGSHREHNIRNLYVPPLECKQEFLHYISFSDSLHWGLPLGVALAEVLADETIVAEPRPPWAPAQNTNSFDLVISWPGLRSVTHSVPVRCLHSELDFQQLAAVVASYIRMYFYDNKNYKWHGYLFDSAKDFRRLRLIALHSTDGFVWYAEFGVIEDTVPESPFAIQYDDEF